MSNSSPLIPQGSLLEEQAKGRPHLRIALCIVAVHLIFLGGLLMQGCKRDDPGDQASGGLPPLELTNFVAPPTTMTSTDTGELVTPVITEFLPPVETNVSEGFGGGMEETQPPIYTDPAVVPDEIQPPIVPAMQDYKVVRGDSFFAIGRRFNVTPTAIAKANPGVDSTRLQIGQILKIPAAGTVDTTPEVGVTPPAGSGVYTVKRGDTLTRIARQYGTTVNRLKEMNGLVTDRIIINQKLNVPVSGGGTGPGN